MLCGETFEEMGNDFIDGIRAGYGDEKTAAANYSQLIIIAQERDHMMRFGPINDALKERFGEDGMVRVKERAWERLTAINAQTAYDPQD